MVNVRLRSLRTPLLCLSGCLFIFLLVRLIGTPKNLPRLSLLYEKAIVHHGNLQEPATDEVATSMDKDDLETLLRGNENEDWAQGNECPPYPRYENIHFPNPYYQLIQSGNLSYYLYGAYYDRRPRIAEVMVLGMVTTCTGPYPETYLQVWYDGDTKAEIVPMHQTKLGWYKEWGNYVDVAYPTLLTFQMKSKKIPRLVSLVFGNPCALPQNALQVQVQPPPEYEEAPPNPNRRPRIGVCVKYLNFPDIDMSERFVEWLELMRLLGASKVTAYDIGKLMPNTSRTLAHYTRPEDGLLDLRKFQFPEETKTYERFRSVIIEVLLYNDCLYRSLYDFDFIAVLDVDEVIMPLGQLRNWQDLLGELQSRDVNCTARSSYCFRNVYYPKELPEDGSIPKPFYMLRHVVRVADHLNPALAIKCLHDIGHVTVLHNHFALQWMDSCAPFDVHSDLAQMQHYRHVDDLKTLKEPPPVRDDNIRRLQQQLIHNSMQVHRQLGWGAAY
ncbi:uncharacterized protein LOC108103872 [Drosophila eugracilis]|uniref:uncharacterized protein LOC108103872 n=1 Tax=Drosophila eugracilis TaxID=29029 RepID=UPI0007E6867E|nr:uncharacterized protein LOC108103872 [Drosophila eugracilis]